MIASTLPTRTVKTEELESGMVILTSAWAAVVTDAYPLPRRFSADPTDYIQVDWTMVEVAPDADGNMPAHRVVGYSSDFTMANGQHEVLEDPAAYFLALRDQTADDIAKLKANVQALKDDGADTAEVMDAQLLVNLVRSQVMDLYTTWLCLALTGRHVESTDGFIYSIEGAGPGDSLMLAPLDGGRYYEADSSYVQGIVQVIG